MKNLKSIVKATIILYLTLSIVASIAVAAGCYDVIDYKGALTVVAVQPANEHSGLTVYQYSPFCNQCDVFLWLIEFEADGNIRLASDGLDCFGMY